VVVKVGRPEALESLREAGEEVPGLVSPALTPLPAPTLFGSDPRACDCDCDVFVIVIFVMFVIMF
jgi:hypothetical protein